MSRKLTNHFLACDEKTCSNFGLCVEKLKEKSVSLQKWKCCNSYVDLSHIIAHYHALHNICCQPCMSFNVSQLLSSSSASFQVVARAIMENCVSANKQRWTINFSVTTLDACVTIFRSARREVARIVFAKSTRTKVAYVKAV
jgi:hypothetical protein